MEGANEGHFDWNFEQRILVRVAANEAAARPQRRMPPLPRAKHGWRRSIFTPTTSPGWRPRCAIISRDEPIITRPNTAFVIQTANGTGCRRADAAFAMHPARCIASSGSAIDITARKNAEAEKERLEIQLRQSQKMEAMGTLAGGIAHDFNNILGAILGYGELAQKAAPEGGVVRRYLDNVMQAGGRAKALVERILAFSRSGVGERGLVNVQAVIEETLELLAASLAPGVRLEQTARGRRRGHRRRRDPAAPGGDEPLHECAAGDGEWRRARGDAGSRGRGARSQAIAR